MSKIKLEHMMLCKNKSREVRSFYSFFQDFFLQQNAVALTTQHKRYVSDETQFLTLFSLPGFYYGKVSQNSHMLSICIILKNKLFKLKNSPSHFLLHSCYR